MRRDLSVAILFWALSAGHRAAHDTPIGVAGTQVATESTPAAAGNWDELRKQAHNPVARSHPFALCIIAESKQRRDK
jgi:hypothetical protein